MSKFIDWCKNYWKDNLIEIAIVLISFGFLVFRLGKVTQGFSKSERSIQYSLINNQYTFSYIVHNLVMAPYLIGLTLLQHLRLYSLIDIRAVGVFFGLIAAFEFFYIIRKLFGNFIAFMTTIIFVDSLWFLQAARVQGGDILYLVGILTLIIVAFLHHESSRFNLKLFISIIAVALILYIPGMIWFFLVALVLKRKTIYKGFKDLDIRLSASASLLWVILVAPLVLLSIDSTSTLRQILDIPSVFRLGTIVRNFYGLPLTLFIRSTRNSYLDLGHLPIFEVFSTIMIMIGAIWLVIKKKLKVIGLISIGLVIGWILYALGNGSIYFTLPLIMIFAASGLSYLIKQWYTVFPRNPVAQKVGLGLIVLAILSVALLHANQFYIAWPRTDKSISVFSHDN